MAATRYKTAVDMPVIGKGQLDPAESAPALGKGQPLRVTTWPLEKTIDLFLCITCPDGESPDFVVGNNALSGSGQGDMLTVGYASAPALLGGTVKKGDLLTVKSGKFTKAATGNLCVGRASVDGVSGDIISILPLTQTAP